MLLSKALEFEDIKALGLDAMSVVFIRDAGIWLVRGSDVRYSQF